jgi:hypothetical protein
MHSTQAAGIVRPVRCDGSEVRVTSRAPTGCAWFAARYLGPRQRRFLDVQYSESSGDRAITSSGCFVVLGLEAAPLKPRIDPSRNLGPEPEINELEPELFVRQEAANESFNRSL